MTGKRYYISTLADWQRYAGQFSNSHWLALAPIRCEAAGVSTVVGDESAGAPSGAGEVNVPIIVLVEADEGAHLALEDDAAFEELPHPLVDKPISAKAEAALSGVGVNAGATTFDVSEALARFHPLLRHRVF